MPFFKRKDSVDASASAKTNGNGNGTDAAKEKINYKARLEHKMYLVRSHFFQRKKARTERRCHSLRKEGRWLLAAQAARGVRSSLPQPW